MLKTCFVCKVEKRLLEFYPHPQMRDGHLNKCKECTKEGVRLHYQQNRQVYKNKDLSRNKLAARKKTRAESQRRHRAQHPEKYKARTALNNALRDGRIEKSLCFYCGSLSVQAHHADYLKPLDVKWVCFSCHRMREHGQVV